MATTAKTKLQTYRFEVGNSSTGPLGAVVRVEATSVEEALVLLNKAVPVDGANVRSFGLRGRVDIQVYFGEHGWGIPEVEA